MTEIDAANRTLLQAVQSICWTIIAVFVLGAVTYRCTQPTAQIQVDQEAQATRVIENNKMVACVKSGGSWMPITDGLHTQYRGSPYYTSSMSCVTDKTLPLAYKMNAGKE